MMSLYFHVVRKKEIGLDCERKFKFKYVAPISQVVHDPSVISDWISYRSVRGTLAERQKLHG